MSWCAFNIPFMPSGACITQHRKDLLVYVSWFLSWLMHILRSQVTAFYVCIYHMVPRFIASYQSQYPSRVTRPSSVITRIVWVSVIVLSALLLYDVVVGGPVMVHVEHARKPAVQYVLWQLLLFERVKQYLHYFV